MLKNIYRYFIKDALYKSSLYVTASSLVQAVLGFVFWVFVARLYPAKSVGISAALLSVTSLLSNFSSLGVNPSLIRYLPKSNKRNEIINTSLLLNGAASLIIAGIFLFGVRFFSPHLVFLQTSYFYIGSFSLFLIFSTWNDSVESTFMAYHSSGNILFKNIILSILKLIFPFFFVFLGAYGIFASLSLSVLISALLGFVILIKNHAFVLKFSFNTKVLREVSRFSLGNYLSNFLFQTPLLVLPLLIINFIRPEAAAYFYVASMILNVILIIPVSTTLALLTEGSYDNTELARHIKKTITLTALLLIPAVIGVFLLGKQVLHFFGENYALSTFGLLCLLSISSFFTSIALIGNSILKVRHKIQKLIYLNILGCIIVLVCSFVFISHGLVPLGIGWLIGQVLMSFLFIEVLFKELRA